MSPRQLHRAVNLSTHLSGSSEGLPFERAWRHGGRVSDAQTRRLSRLLLKVLFGQGIELRAVLLFDDAALAVKGLDVVEPGDAVGDPGVGRLEAIL